MDFPEKKDWRARFCCTLLEWVEKETSLEMMEFLRDYRYARTTLYDWVKRYPDIKRVYEHCMLVLGARRRIGALKKEYDRETAFRDMHVYDPEWLEINKYHAELKQHYMQDHAGSFVINLPPAPVTGLVPPLKKAGENEESER